MCVSVIIPSILRPSLEAAVQSIRTQTTADRIDLQIIVGIASDAQVTSDLASKFGVLFRKSASGRSAAANINAAAQAIDGEYVALLEDDDRWTPQFLEIALNALEGADFASSTTLQLTEQNEIVCIGDFPVPSGWIMKRSAWETIGGFNEAYRLHGDNEWLGRLAEKRIPRIHLVEATAPITRLAVQVHRPQLLKLLQCGGPALRLVRHASPFPLILRTVHASSIMARIATNRASDAEHAREYETLMRRFRRIPW